MKAIMLSTQPKWVAKIMNGEKTIEIRKRFPKDFVGWVYIYVTNGKDILCRYYDGHWFTTRDRNNNWKRYLNGKVVARFWGDKVEEIKYHNRQELIRFYSKGNEHQYLWLKETCLTFDELDNYLKGKNGYAIHISQLEIFDKPKELSEFGLKRAAQSWQYVEVE